MKYFALTVAAALTFTGLAQAEEQRPVVTLQGPIPNASNEIMSAHTVVTWGGNGVSSSYVPDIRGSQSCLSLAYASALIRFSTSTTSCYDRQGNLKEIYRCESNRSNIVCTREF